MYKASLVPVKPPVHPSVSCVLPLTVAQVPSYPCCAACSPRYSQHSGTVCPLGLLKNHLSQRNSCSISYTYMTHHKIWYCCSFALGSILVLICLLSCPFTAHCSIPGSLPYTQVMLWLGNIVVRFFSLFPCQVSLYKSTIHACAHGSAFVPPSVSDSCCLSVGRCVSSLESLLLVSCFRCFCVCLVLLAGASHAYQMLCVSCPRWLPSASLSVPTLAPVPFFRTTRLPAHQKREGLQVLEGTRNFLRLCS